MPDFHSHTLKPWSVERDRIVLHEWPESFPDGAVVKVVGNVFAECDMMMVRSEDERLISNRLDRASNADMHNCDLATHSGLRHDLFRLMDRHPRVWWILETEHNWLTITNDWPLISDGTESGENVERYYPNVALAVTVRNQHDADRLLPELIRCRDLCGRLCVYFTGEERVDFGRWLGKPCPNKCEQTWVESDCYVCHGAGWISPPEIDTIIIRGHESAPTDLDAVRDTVRQCDEAGVGCWVESLSFQTILASRIANVLWSDFEKARTVSGGMLIPADLRAVNERFQKWEGVNA